MIPVSSFKGKHVALFGLGGSGLVTARALLAGGAKVTAYDDNPNSVEKAKGEGISTADFRGEDWSAFDALILAPGVPLTHPQPHWTVDLAKKPGIEIIGDVELFSRELDTAERSAPFVAITGTNGKSTTTALIAHVLASAGRDVQMGGNIGRAVLDLDPFSDEPANQVYVVECSSYQIDLAPSLHPDVGILLNLTPDHLERHGTIENYAAIKERLLEGSDLSVVGVDDTFGVAIEARLEKAGKPLVKISQNKQLVDSLYCFDGTGISDDEGEQRATISEIGSLRGQHNGQNAAAAFAVCEALGLSDEEIQTGFKTFPGLAHRMEQVGHVDGVLFINDSKATNAEAAAPALSSFPKIHWIAGGLAKDGGIESLKPQFSHIEKAYFIGEAAGNFAAQLNDTIPYEISGTLQHAVNHALKDAVVQENAVVLLSPAAASFDQFQNFEIRGEAFKEIVRSLAGFEEIEETSS